MTLRTMDGGSGGLKGAPKPSDSKRSGIGIMTMPYL